MRNTKIYKILQTSQAYIFRILQYFATKLCNFPNFEMFFLAVVKDFAFFENIKIQFKRGMVHWFVLLVLSFTKSSNEMRLHVIQLCYCYFGPLVYEYWPLERDRSQVYALDSSCYEMWLVFSRSKTVLRPTNFPRIHHCLAVECIDNIAEKHFATTIFKKDKAFFRLDIPSRNWKNL